MLSRDPFLSAPTYLLNIQRHVAVFWFQSLINRLSFLMPSKTSLPLRLSMPNTGKPSAGCDACRRMKVKCGEERPACARCRRVGRECRYRDPPSIFHPMNDSAKLSSEKPRRGQKRSLDIDTSASLLGQPDISKRSRSPLQWVAPPQSAAGPRSSASTSRAPSSASPRRHRPVSPAIEASLMSKDWEEAAISFYLSEFVIYPEENSQQPGYLEFLPDLLNEQPEATHLKEALKSVALSAMGNRSCMEQLSLQAQRSYGKALAEVSLALNDKTMQKADSTLVALILLGQYEVCSIAAPSKRTLTRLDCLRRSARPLTLDVSWRRSSSLTFSPRRGSIPDGARSHTIPARAI